MHRLADSLSRVCQAVCVLPDEYVQARIWLQKPQTQASAEQATPVSDRSQTGPNLAVEDPSWGTEAERVHVVSAFGNEIGRGEECQYSSALPPTL